MAFDEARLGGGGFEVFEDGIEPLDVAHLQEATVLPGQLHQLGGLRGAVGHRFFHEHVLALGEQLPGQFEMGYGRGDHVQRVAGGGGLGEGGEDAGLALGGDAARGLGIGVENAGEFDLAGLGEFGVNAGVFLAERTHAEDGHSDG